MSARIVLYENGEERNLDSYSGEEIINLTAAITDLIDSEYTVDLYSGYVFGINKHFVRNFCIAGEVFQLDDLNNTQVEFILEDEDNYLSSSDESELSSSDEDI